MLKHHLLRGRPRRCARRGRAWRRLHPLLAAGLALSCSPSEEAPEPRDSLLGELHGVVRSATALQPSELPTMAGAPVCQSLNERKEPWAKTPMAPEGRLADAFVYVDGPGTPSSSKPLEPVELIEEGCLFHPRVVGLRTGQTLRIVNRDPTLHDVAVEAAVNEAWIETQPFAGMSSERTLERAEVMIPVRCELHPWMRAWVGVVSHPFFAVTSSTGEFTIDGLLPGSYRLEAWHEDLGRQSLEVAVSAGEVTRVEVVFAAQESHAL